MYWSAIISFLLVNFNTTSFFINERTYLPALFYILAGGFFPEYQSLNPALPASLFLMLAIIRIMDGYRKAGIANNFFDAGILISTGSLFYANLIWFGLLIIIGIALIRTVNLSDIAIAILGLLTPYLITIRNLLCDREGYQSSVNSHPGQSLSENGRISFLAADNNRY